MKILFLTLYPDFVPSTRFRIRQYLPHLHADGFETEVIPAISERFYRTFGGTRNIGRGAGYYVAEILLRITTLLRSSDHDIVVLQKGILSFWLRGMERFLKSYEGRLVFDMDDAVYLRPPNGLPRALRFMEDAQQISKIMRMSRSVLAANEELATEARKFNASVYVVPTPVDTDWFCPSTFRDDNASVFRLLWMGNRSGNRYANKMIPILSRLREHGVNPCLVILSDSSDFIQIDNFPPSTVQYIPWSMTAEREQLHLAHAGVMPIDDDSWNRRKSGFKTMIYMACGLPSVSSPVGSITRIVQQGVNGFLADSEEEWVNVLLRLAKNRGECNQIGKNARKTIEKDYSVASLYPRFKNILVQKTG